MTTTCARVGCDNEIPADASTGGYGRGRPRLYCRKTCANLASRQRMRAFTIPTADEEVVAALERAEAAVTELLVMFAQQQSNPIPGPKIRTAAKLLVANAMAAVAS